MGSSEDGLKGERWGRKDVAKFNDKFYHFKFVTLEMFMVAKRGIQ